MPCLTPHSSTKRAGGSDGWSRPKRDPLALARRIAEVHGGRIWVESEGPGRGCTVCFTLPGAPPPVPVASA